MDEAERPPWGRYLQLQHQVANSDTESARSRGADEALNDLLEKIEQGVELDERQVERLCENRAAKHRHRMKDDLLLAPNEDTSAIDGETRAVAQLLLEALQEKLAPSDRSLLAELANGHTYKELAKRRGATVEALKTRVSRLRSQLRADNEDLDDFLADRRAG